MQLRSIVVSSNRQEVRSWGERYWTDVGLLSTHYINVDVRSLLRFRPRNAPLASVGFSAWGSRPRLLDAVRIAAVRHRVCKPPANAKLALRLAQRQQARIDDWLPLAKSTVSFLRSTAGRSNGSSVLSVMAAVSEG